MRRRIATGVAIVGLGLGVLGASPAAAAPEDKFFKDVAHFVCGFEVTQELVAEELGVQANRGQCQKAVRAFLSGGGGV